MDVEYDDPRTEWMDLTPPADPPEEPARSFGELIKMIGAGFGITDPQVKRFSDHIAKLDKAMSIRFGLSALSSHVHIHIPRMSGPHFSWSVRDDFMLWPRPIMKPSRVIRSSRHNCFGKKKADQVDMDFVMGLPVTYATEIKLKSIPVPVPPGKARYIHTKPLTEARRR